MGLIINLPFAVLMFFVQDIYEFWTRGKLEFDLPLFAFLGVAVLLLNYGGNYMNYLRSINHLKGLLTVTITRAIATIGISFMFIDSLGLLAIGIAIFVAEILSSVIIPARVVGGILRQENMSIPLEVKAFGCSAYGNYLGVLFYRNGQFRICRSRGRICNWNNSGSMLYAMAAT